MSRDHEADHSDRAALLAEIQRLKAQARVIHKLVYLDQEQP